MSGEYSVRNEKDLDSESDDAEPWRKILVFEANKLPGILQSIKSALSAS